ncbi:unnamed protein product [Schistosoma margrebowiei]|uniref:Uncharacterized protein n=1 Tax=Schistosoma margrebowiei TaxID=48269 RepID=A0A183L8N8_9TREM|nr:unnamed protein product [Schistosoma margrebowiei]
MVGGSQHETPGLGFVLLYTHRQGVPVILRKLMLSDRFDPVSPSFTVVEVNTKLSVPRLRFVVTVVVGGGAGGAGGAGGGAGGGGNCVDGIVCHH